MQLDGLAAPDTVALPLHCVSPTGLAALRDRLPPEAAGFLDASGFEARPQEIRLLPGNGGVAGAVLGLGEAAPTPWSFGGLPHALQMTAFDPAWDGIRGRIAEAVATRDRDDWADAFAELDACVSPVLSLAEAPEHPHNRARNLFESVGGILQPRPTPHFVGTPGAIQGPPPIPGAHTSEVLAEWGFSMDEIQHLSA